VTIRIWFAVTAACAAICLVCFSSYAQDGILSYGDLRVRPIQVIPTGTIVRPESGIPSSGTFHTHIQILIPNTTIERPPRASGLNPPHANYDAQTPASLACVYYLVVQSNGCDPYQFFTVATGGSKAIGVVDAYYDATVVSDLQNFSTYFSLPPPNITVVYCNKTSCSTTNQPPPANHGWSLEQTLDVEVSHSMAPNAQIILVEAYSNSYADLLRAEAEAASLVAAAGGGEVTNSWGSEEFSNEATYDSNFVEPGVVFFASAGDSPGVEYPSASPNVVAVGGTTVLLGSNFSFMYEETWPSAGGGFSTYEPVPSFQSAVKSVEAKVGAHRGVPDIAADANPSSGLWVYCSASSCGSGPWWIVGGTSLSSPLVASITNSANTFNPSSVAELDGIYNNLGSSDFDYVTHGYCNNGPRAGLVTAASGWDVCTGVGTPQGHSGL